MMAVQQLLTVLYSTGLALLNPGTCQQHYYSRLMMHAMQRGFDPAPNLLFVMHC
jgi:hypothetical protein